MANLNRRAALIGAATSAIALSGGIGASLAGVRPREVSDIIRELQAALRDAGRQMEVVVSAEGYRIDYHPRDPWDLLVAQCDDMAAGCDGWCLVGGRSVMGSEGSLAFDCAGPTLCTLEGIVLEARPTGGYIERRLEMGRIA